MSRPYIQTRRRNRRQRRVCTERSCVYVDSLSPVTTQGPHRQRAGVGLFYLVFVFSENPTMIRKFSGTMARVAQTANDMNPLSDMVIASPNANEQAFSQARALANGAEIIDTGEAQGFVMAGRDATLDDFHAAREKARVNESTAVFLVLVVYGLFLGLLAQYDARAMFAFVVGQLFGQGIERISSDDE